MKLQSELLDERVAVLKASHEWGQWENLGCVRNEIKTNAVSAMGDGVKCKWEKESTIVRHARARVAHFFAVFSCILFGTFIYPFFYGILLFANSFYREFLRVFSSVSRLLFTIFVTTGDACRIHIYPYTSQRVDDSRRRWMGGVNNRNFGRRISPIVTVFETE